MADREKVIKGLEYCVGHHLCLGCRYYDPNNTRCQIRLMREALELLKEQEQRINFLEEGLRLLEYGDQGTLQSGLMPAT